MLPGFIVYVDHEGRKNLDAGVGSRSVFVTELKLSTQEHVLTVVDFREHMYC